jgi:hypothetical protein
MITSAGNTRPLSLDQTWSASRANLQTCDNVCGVTEPIVVLTHKGVHMYECKCSGATGSHVVCKRVKSSEM